MNRYVWKVCGKKVFADGSCNRLYDSQLKNDFVPSAIVVFFLTNESGFIRLGRF